MMSEILDLRLYVPCLNAFVTFFCYLGEPVKEAFESVVTYMLDTNSVLEVKNRQFHVIEHSALHLVFKKLIQLENPDEPSGERFILKYENKYQF